MYPIIGGLLVTVLVMVIQLPAEIQRRLHHETDGIAGLPEYDLAWPNTGSGEVNLVQYHRMLLENQADAAQELEKFPAYPEPKIGRVDGWRITANLTVLPKVRTAAKIFAVLSLVGVLLFRFLAKAEDHFFPPQGYDAFGTYSDRTTPHETPHWLIAVVVALPLLLMISILGLVAIRSFFRISDAGRKLLTWESHEEWREVWLEQAKVVDDEIKRITPDMEMFYQIYPHMRMSPANQS